MEGESLSPVESRRHWVIEQLAGVSGLPGVTVEAQSTVAHFLATHAFRELEAPKVRFLTLLVKCADFKMLALRIHISHSAGTHTGHRACCADIQVKFPFCSS